MRTRLAALLTALTTVAALAATTAAPVGAQAVTDQAFGGYGSGATLSVNVLGLLNTQVLNLQAASAGQSTNSQGLPAGGLVNELGYAIQPGGISDRNAYGRGTGLEVGVLTPDPNPNTNQILLSGLAQQAAPPNAAAADVKQIGPVQIGSLAYVNLLRSRARALWDDNTCVIGKPFSFGEGEAAGLQLIGTPGPDGVLQAPVLGTTLPAVSDDPRNVSRTRSVTYLRPNGDGTYAVVSETRQTIAPVALLGGAVTLELLGEWALRAIATGKPGGAAVEYAPVGAGPSTTVAKLTIGATVVEITTQQLFGPGGLDLGAALGPLAAVLDIKVGTPARALGGAGAPQLAANGTSASAAVDVASIGVLQIPNVLTGADVRLGHMEAAAVAPEGGVRCNVPVTKTASPDPVTAGQDFTVTIRIPSDEAQFAQLFGCSLIGIRVVDVHEIESGNPSFQLLSASHGGVISADGTTVTWDNIGDYRIGDPPIELTINGRIPSTSGAGVLKDTATITATLGGCDGTADGQDIVGQGVSGGTVTGVFTLFGPDVSRTGVLAATGGDERLLVLGGLFLLGALAVRRRMRRPVPTA